MKENLLVAKWLTDIPPPTTASQGANTDRVSPVGVCVDESYTLHSSVALSGANHNTRADNLNETTSPIVSENGRIS